GVGAASAAIVELAQAIHHPIAAEAAPTNASSFSKAPTLRLCCRSDVSRDLYIGPWGWRSRLTSLLHMMGPGRPRPPEPRLGAALSAKLGALGRQGFALYVPVDQALAFLFDHGGWGVVDEGLAGQLALALADLGLHALEFLVQPGALGAQVDQAFQRYQQL